MTAATPPLAATGAPEGDVAVLLVDDQLLIGEAVRRMLAPEAGIRYRYVSDPRQAIDAAKEFRPTVILSDLVMPQMDGLELVRLLRADDATRKIPLIVLSSKEEPATKAEAFRRGANDYLVKLPDRIELIARIRYHSAGYVSVLERDAAYGALRDDLDEAVRYVQSLLPEPLNGRIRTRWRYVPSAALGGDAFGYHWIDDDHFVVYLLDVSGHGVGAALLGVSVLNVLRARSLPGTEFRDPGSVLEGLSGAFSFDTHGGKYFTIWYGVYRPSTRELRWAGGGHPSPLMFPLGGGAPVALECLGPMPGVVPGLAFEGSAVAVPGSARLLLYSDGIYEIRKADGTTHDFEGFTAEMAGAGGDPRGPMGVALARAERLANDVRFDDDVSVLEVEFPD